MRLFRLLDVSGMFHPIWRVKEGAGKPIGEAASETVQALREHAARAGADFVIACCDAPGRNFRHDIAEEYRALVPDYKGYKGHRPEKDPAMMAALDRVIDELEQDGVPIMRVPGFEADDVIATIAAWATANGDSVEVVSEDKDLLALARDVDPDNDTAPSVVVIRRDGTRQGYDQCVQRLGVPPELVPAMLAMAGDTSDGILGIPGIGKKTAAALLWGEWEGREWRPTPFRRLGAMVDAAVEEQALVEMIEREKLRRRVEAGTKKNASDATIAERLKISIEDVERYRTMPAQDIPADHKPRFAADVRRSLIANAESFDIGLRLAELRRDVPLDFAALTAPRVPKKRPNKTPWSEIASPNATQPETLIVTEEEEDIMAQETQAPASSESELLPPLPPPAHEVRGESVAQPPPTAAVVAPTRQIVKFTPEQFKLALEPQTYEMARTVAEDMYDSGLFAVARVQAALALIQVGRAHGLSAVTSLMEIHMIEGKPQMSAKLMVALVRKSGKADYFKLVEAGPTGAKWKTHRKDDPDPDPVFGSFTIEEAKRALLGGIASKGKDGLVIGTDFKPESQYAKYPEDMCVWRAAVRLIRREYSDVIGGLYATEEMDEYAPTQSYPAAA